MKNSKGETLPQPYLDLARMRKGQQGGEGDQIAYENCINWRRTPEGGQWWMQVYECKSPVLPAASLAELDAWRKAKGVPAEPADTPNYMEIFEDYKDRLANLEWRHERVKENFERILEERNRYRSQCHKYEMEKAEPATNWKAMYEEMKAERDYYRHEYELKSIELDDIDNKPTPTRNWVAECAMAAMQGYLAMKATRSVIPSYEEVSREAWGYAEAMAAEGRKRGHIN